MSESTRSHKNNTTIRKKFKGAPDYDNASYWDTKFVTGQDAGEWLNEGALLIDAAVSELERRYSTPVEGIDLEDNKAELRPRALHLGPGLSALGSKLCDAFMQRDWKGSDIVNVDFSSEAVRLGRERENEKFNPDHAMRWIQADLRSWTEVSNGILPYAPFDVILEKSTSDAIATSEPFTYHQSSAHSNGQDKSTTSSWETLCPALQQVLADEPTFKEVGSLTLSPVELLSMHLFPLAREGAIWLVFSYSSVRFHDLPYLNRHWTLISSTPVKAPSGQASSAVAMVPDVFHWMYVLRRN